MAVNMKLSQDWWLAQMRQVDATKQDFQKVIEKIVLASGDILLKAIEEEIDNDEVLTARAKRLFKENLQNKIVYSSVSRVKGETGLLFKKYDDKNPEVGVIGIWLNYGTKLRTVDGRNRGFIWPAGFIQRARKKTEKKINQLQMDMVNDFFEEHGIKRIIR